MNDRVWRVVGVVTGLAVASALIVLYVGLYLTNASGTAAATTSAQGTQLFLGTVPAAEANDKHPTWVSYYAVDGQSHNWRHDTTFRLPAHTLVRITVYNYDGQSGLRNPFISRATGTVGDSFSLDGKPTQQVDPDAASHIFAIPQLGVSVPIEGVDDNAKNQCGNAPCDLTQAHTTTTFTIRTPGPGLYRWQCLVPCAAGFIQGWGGPMQTVGYMDGYIQVA